MDPSLPQIPGQAWSGPPLDDTCILPLDSRERFPCRGVLRMGEYLGSRVEDLASQAQTIGQ